MHACTYVARLRWHAALTLYASGQTTGVVVEIHSRGVAVSAVYEGYLLPYTIQTSDIGGEMIGRCLVPAVERTVGCVFANPIETTAEGAWCGANQLAFHSLPLLPD